MTRHGILFLGIVATLCSAAIASAQERPLNNSANDTTAPTSGTDTTTTTTTTTGTDGSASDVAMHDEQANMEGAHEHTPGATRHARDGSDPYEDPHESYYTVGLMYRHFIVGTYALNFFVDGGKVVDEPGFGAQFTYRKDGLSISGQVWGQGAGFSGIFREAGQGPNETEFWQSNWNVVWAAASFMWSTQFNDMLALEYGFDVGVGVVYGNAYRTEAYAPTGVATNDYQRWQSCSYTGSGGMVHAPPAFPPSPGTIPTGSPGAGSPIPGFSAGAQPGIPGDTSTCGGPPVADGVRGEQYGENIRNWSNGGSVPIVVPWLGVPHIALRFKPVRQLEMRLDAGAFAGILAFYFGGSISYGF